MISFATFLPFTDHLARPKVNLKTNRNLKNWYIYYSTTSQCHVLENIMSQPGVQWVIKKPTYIPDNFVSRIDLTFTSQTNLIIESGFYLSLHPKCHHQVVYTTFNLHNFHPPQFYWEVWHWKDANIELIRQTIDGFNWQTAFSNKNVMKKV